MPIESSRSWEAPLRNLLAYLPRTVRHWIVTFEEPYHQRLAGVLREKLGGGLFIDTSRTSRSAVREVAKKFESDDGTGLLAFMVTHAGYTPRGEHHADALHPFLEWPPTRVKLCIDVTDQNFADLFSESPSELRRRCEELKRKVEVGSLLEYEDGRGSAFRVRYGRRPWNVASGFEEFSDYILPAGEINCLPVSVEGDLSLDGWIVGTLPFGLKFGRITNGELEVRVKNSEVIDVRGENEKLRRDLAFVLDQYPSLRKVSELGIGQSRAVTRASAVHKLGYLWHEVRFGVHLGFGAELPSQGVDEPVRGHHLDLVLHAGRLKMGNGVEVLRW